MKFDKNKVTTVPAITLFRLFKCIWRQKSKTAVCPDEPRLDGKLALVTGGNDGIGLETSKGLAKLGADIIILARNKTKTDKAIQEIKELTGKESYFVPLDLANLESVITAVDIINKQWPNRTIDLFIANAGIIPTNYSQSAQGFEKTFAVNTLGHFVMIRKLYNSSKLTAGARIIMVAGDIYILAKDCTPDFKYDKPKENQSAYCRSKLGVMWIVQEFSKRYKDIETYAVHPGVVASGLMGETSGLLNKLRHAMFLSTEQGAQTSLICATQKDLISGDYYHNTLGKALLRQNDPAKNNKKSVEFLKILEDIFENYVK